MRAVLNTWHAHASSHQVAVYLEAVVEEWDDGGDGVTYGALLPCRHTEPNHYNSYEDVDNMHRTSYSFEH